MTHLSILNLARISTTLDSWSENEMSHAETIRACFYSCFGRESKDGAIEIARVFAGEAYAPMHARIASAEALNITLTV